ncbi:MAG: tRNA 2-thiocytidine biosynthesis protein TtcA [Clostridia bacterium]|nr:tRNA 2-thiocytidine biosynthesis protein TtcA [Clostridia bacterium]
MQELMSRMRAAMEKYDMVSPGDKIAVGVSGGKDSLALLFALNEIRRFYPVPYDVIAISVDPCFFGRETDYGAIEKLCEEKNIPYYIKRTQLFHIIFETRKEKNPCSLCARMRRGMLHDMCLEHGSRKLALGHHMDDAAETFMMNLLSGGDIGSFRPVTYLSRKDIYMIRPMIFASEKEVIRAANRTSLPVIKSPCPMDGESERENVKQLLGELGKKYPSLNEKITGAMQKNGISGW